MTIDCKDDDHHRYILKLVSATMIETVVLVTFLECLQYIYYICIFEIYSPANQQADFGLSLQLARKTDFENKEANIVGDFPGKERKKLKLVCGTPSYMAPEILQRQPLVPFCTWGRARTQNISFWAFVFTCHTIIITITKPIHPL